MSYQFIIPATGMTSNQLLKINLDLINAGSGATQVKEYVTQSSAISLTSGTPAQIVEITPGEGTWLLLCAVGFTGGAPTTLLEADVTQGTAFDNPDELAVPTSSSGDLAASLPVSIANGDATLFFVTVSTEGTDQSFLHARATFPSGSVSAYGSILALKIG